MCRIPGVYLGRGYGCLIITSAVLTALHRYFVCDQSKSFSDVYRQALGTAFPLLPVNRAASLHRLEPALDAT